MYAAANNTGKMSKKKKKTEKNKNVAQGLKSFCIFFLIVSE